MRANEGERHPGDGDQGDIRVSHLLDIISNRVLETGKLKWSYLAGDGNGAKLPRGAGPKPLGW